MIKYLYILSILAPMFLSAQTDKNKKLLADAKELIYKDPEQTVEKAKKVLHGSQKEDMKISALVTMINAQMVMGQARNVIDNSNEALAIARKEKDSLNEILLLAMLGNQYQAMMMTEKAKKYLDLAENKMNVGDLSKDLLYIKGNVYNIKGILFRGELNCEFALKYFDKAIDVYKMLPKNNLNEANQLLVEIQKGFCLISEGKIDSAERSFLMVLDHNIKIDLGYNRFFAKVGLAEILTRRKQYKQSLILLDEIPVDDGSEKYDHELFSLYYLARAKNYLGIGDMDNYMAFSKKYEEEIDKMNRIQDNIIDQTIKDSQSQSQEKIKQINRFNLLLIFIISTFFTIVTFILLKKRFFSNKK